MGAASIRSISCLLVIGLLSVKIAPVVSRTHAHGLVKMQVVRFCVRCDLATFACRLLARASRVAAVLAAVRFACFSRCCCCQVCVLAKTNRVIVVVAVILAACLCLPWTYFFSCSFHRWRTQSSRLALRVTPTRSSSETSTRHGPRLVDGMLSCCLVCSVSLWVLLCFLFLYPFWSGITKFA